MTLTMAWVRSIGTTRELVIASDSRLRGGYEWDAAPKIIPLERHDCAVAFSGTTALAYPMMIQLVYAANAWTKSATRAQPLDQAKGHFIRVINRMLQELRDDSAVGVLAPSEVSFLLGGFAWDRQEFKVWRLSYNSELDEFHFDSIPWWRGPGQDRLYVAIGDGVDEAKALVTERLRTAGSIRGGGFDMEPLYALSELIDNPEFPQIGGEQQLVKVYRYLRAVPVVVTRRGKRSLLGRPLMEYEHLDRHPSYDLADLEAD